MVHLRSRTPTALRATASIVFVAKPLYPKPDRCYRVRCFSEPISHGNSRATAVLSYIMYL